MKILRTKKAITLISLVVTIVILLILAGVTISTLTGENGLINKAAHARNKTNYETAFEKVKVKIMEANTKYYQEKNREATLDELKTYMSDKNEIEILVKKYHSSASEKTDINQITGTLEGMEVQIPGYEQYIFFIGQTCSVESVSIDDGTTFVEISKFDPVTNEEKETQVDKDTNTRNIEINNSTWNLIAQGSVHLDFNNDNMNLYTTSSAYCCGSIYDINKMNLSEYSKLKCEVIYPEEKYYGNMIFGITDDTKVDGYYRFSYKKSCNISTTSNEKTIYEVDLTDIDSSEYYIAFSGWTWQFNIYRVWLEK